RHRCGAAARPGGLGAVPADRAAARGGARCRVPGNCRAAGRGRPGAAAGRPGAPAARARARHCARDGAGPSPRLASCRARCPEGSDGMKTIALLMSGGDSPGMNAALRAAAKTCAARGVRLLGVREGFEGLIDAQMVEVVPGPCLLLGETGLDVLGSQGGAVLGSARSARFREPAGRAQAAETLRSAGVDGLVVLGGNGSMTGAHVLPRERGVGVIGIRASIDNDIGCTAVSIGTDTALNPIVQACDRVDDPARAHRRSFVVEVMGRASGYLAMASAVAVGA